MAERPDYCRGADCPLYNPNFEVGCLIQSWIRMGWPSVIGRRKLIAAYLKKAKENPEQVRSECQGKLGSTKTGSRAY
jgi:hypothetical protein